ncbi:carbohydrate sulfotransferase 11-like isoform X1 [Pieris brassicae]|uniref:carbohydrate sulfotransferase 11-like isoform X1 n=1 Tax=Pieris brassicae TaxID=7116 RepID=UPI001E65FC85|nr:carbohydrate sulfotransferase 11-like isoform X1 [Pieris brassicae]XP_045523205.1 carbohydrate sulfotransferase 11-like isoform X1 [Pieris brassicae]XP_045523206.1 carbohydrate sulfotransferase 11-like isoform X1 [Pieris brassicae]XP_045523208.1 carbohydrate sulfotransferase 11-like isoform X1 [Pieris brassicae]XP_045523209.1 carbohydrate sulfotransferase 11-like isoform X1 [Pieris brassicae]
MNKRGKRNVGMIRLGRCVAFLAAAAFLLPFTILLMVADQQYNFTYNSKRIFYQESDFYKINGTYYAPVTTPFYRTQFVFENGTRDDGLLSREKFLEVGARMDSRREFLRSECSRLSLDGSSQKAYAWEYLINRQYHVIWCNIFKAASTSWMYNFNLMANYTAAFLNRTKEVPLELARKRYARPTVEMIRKAQGDSITFLIVRHPLERLASAYNDKIVHAWPKSFHDKMGRRIIKKYRKASESKPAPIERYPVFEEFVSYVLDETKAKRTLDMHWTPYTSFCTPCKFNFDVILKFETLDEDQRFLIQMSRLQDIVRPEWRNSGKGTNTLHNINHLYSRLSRSQLDGLYNLYRYDFQLFNYTIQNYYDIIHSEDTTYG